MDILTGENLASLYVADIKLIYWPVRSSSRRGRDGVSLFEPAKIITLIRVHEHPLQHP